MAAQNWGILLPFLTKGQFPGLSTGRDTLRTPCEILTPIQFQPKHLLVYIVCYFVSQVSNTQILFLKTHHKSDWKNYSNFYKCIKLNKYPPKHNGDSSFMLFFVPYTFSNENYFLFSSKFQLPICGRI